MTTTIEVMRQALDALKECNDLMFDGGPVDQAFNANMLRTIDTLRAEIERLEKVEPVAWMYSEDTRGGTGVISFDRLSHYSNETPLYTAPAIPEEPDSELEAIIGEAKRIAPVLRNKGHYLAAHIMELLATNATHPAPKPEAT